MGRLVEPDVTLEVTETGTTPIGPATTSLNRGDGPAAKMAKFIPGEVIAFYLSAVKVLDSLPRTEGLRIPVAWSCFIVGFLFTPIYIGLLGRFRDSAVLVNALVSTLAFVVWAYALGGVFSYLDWYRPWLATIILSAFTLMSSRIPVPKRTVRRRQ